MNGGALEMPPENRRVRLLRSASYQLRSRDVLHPYQQGTGEAGTHIRLAAAFTLRSQRQRSLQSRAGEKGARPAYGMGEPQMRAMVLE